MTGHPKIGQEYDVVDPDEMFVGKSDSVVPIGYTDTGNLVVDHYTVEDDCRTVPWQPGAFEQFIGNEVLVESDTTLHE